MPVDLKDDVESLKRGWGEFLQSLKQMDPRKRAIAAGLVLGGIIVILIFSLLFREGINAQVIFVPPSSPDLEPFILVTNLGRTPWKNVVLTLNDTYSLQLERVEAHQEVRAFISTFLAPKGTVPRKLMITCNKGTYVKKE